MDRSDPAGKGGEMRLVIMGNGVAATTTINLVRRARPDVDIVIYSQEPHHYNPRPRLMDVLAGDVPPEGTILPR